MKPEKAIYELAKLRDQTTTDEEVQADTAAHKTWRAKVVALLRASLGTDSSTAQQFEALRYHVGVWTGAPGEAARDAEYFRKRIKDAVGLIDAALYELEFSRGTPAVEGGCYDSGLWDHVKHSVDEERWEQVSSAAVIYVEDKVRRWAGAPTDKNGNRLYGQALFAKALSPGEQLSLGTQINESEGWRNLGIGMVAAVGNVDRHGIQERSDAKQYALGVLGLASLLLTQIRHEHPSTALTKSSS